MATTTKKKFELINELKIHPASDRDRTHHTQYTFFCAVLHNIYNMESKKRPEFLHRVFLLCSFFEFVISCLKGNLGLAMTWLHFYSLAMYSLGEID
jgi:hypothetical protein